MTPRVLDRLVELDDRSRAFPIRTLLDNTWPRSYTWRCSTWLDQRNEGACVGFAWMHELAARPQERHGLVDEDARSIYLDAQRVDQWDGENYSGTSVIAGAKAMKARGYLREYRWAFNLIDALTAISRHGPAVLGIKWLEGMWDTDANGFIHATGDVVGGHAILARGVNVARRTVTLRNSWSPRWGRAGDCLVSWDDLGELLADDGECCLPVLR